MRNNRCIYINGLRDCPQGFLQYMNQFVEAGERTGFRALKPYASPRHLFRRVMPLFFNLANLFRLGNLRSKPLIVTSRGDGILEAAFPYYLSYHIIPMLWDTWPKEQETLFGDLAMLKCPLALVSSRQMAQQIEKRLNIKCMWVPEGIDAAGFSKGDDLNLRSTDVFELGRQHGEYHKAVEAAIAKKYLTQWRGNKYYEDGRLAELAFKTNEELKENLAKAKIVICFPKVDTCSREESGGIETLTQRYWEAMLSRCLIVGRAPAELTDLLGYYPVVDVDWNAPTEQLKNILSNISDYQWLVDKNLEAAKRLAPWDGRMNAIKSFINEHLKA